MERYINDSRAAGIIHTHPTPTYLLLVRSFCLWIKKIKLVSAFDFRGLHCITIKNKYPLAHINSAFQLLPNATIFSKLSLHNAYHLVRKRNGDEWKTAFNTPLGHLFYLVMPFGLTNAPAGFQALVSDVLRDVLNQFVFVYLDDILIFSGFPEEHIVHMRQVL